jgi:hypothetical protein
MAHGSAVRTGQHLPAARLESSRSRRKDPEQRRIAPSVRGYIYTSDFKEKFASASSAWGRGSDRLAAGAITAAGVASAGVTSASPRSSASPLGYGATSSWRGPVPVRLRQADQGIVHGKNQDKLKDASLVPAVLKVQRKQDRVSRRRAQLKGGSRALEQGRHSAPPSPGRKQEGTRRRRTSSTPGQLRGEHAITDPLRLRPRFNQRLMELEYYSRCSEIR